MSYQVGEIGDHRETLIDDEFEGDGGQEKNEGKLKSILRQIQVDRERGERQTTDEELLM